MGDLTVEHTPIPGLLRAAARRAHRRPRLVRRDVAAREDDRRSGCPTSGRCRPTSPRTTRAAPPAGCTPSRGTSWSRSPPDARTPRGSTCAPATTFGTTYAVELEPGMAVFVPRGVGNGYQTLLPTTRRTPTSSTTTGAPTRPTSRSTSPTLRWASTGRSRPRSAWSPSKDLSAPALADVDRCRRAPARSCSAPTVRSGGPCWRSSRARVGVDRTELDLTDDDAARALALGRPRRRAQRRGVHRGRPRRDARRTARGLGRQRRGPGVPGPAGGHGTASRSCTTRPTTSSTAPATSTTRTSRWRRSGVYGQSKAAGDVAVASRAAALPPAHLVGGRRRRQLRAHDGPAGRRGRVTRRWSPTRSVG